MSKKMMLLALAVVSAAMFAVPAVASAGEWLLDNGANKTFAIDKTTNPVLRVANGDVVTCVGLNGSGIYTTITTGHITLDFTGCTENTFGTACQTKGAEAGTFTFANKVFHNVIIGNAGDELTPIGILITGGSEFTTFECAGGLLTFKVTGNVIGQIESPNCKTAGTTYNMAFAPVAAGSSVQKYKQITTAGANFNLISTIAGTNYESSLEGKARMTLSEAGTPTCT